ncbi:MAG TPA: LemA family protein [Spirochaetota bacterium]|nr:LemA family protein [Spirochaetota bacterium]HOL56506.1 LemA family protein [Spirochaetota bacterium]HPP03952.1 LemA family protein [Spirochaetota bacterium]
MKKIYLINILILSFVLIGCNPISIYNTIVEKEEAVNAAWAQVENQYQRRMDLIPQLVEVVKGYAKHEKETLESVIKMRSQATQMVVTKEVLEDPVAFEKFQKMQGELSSALSRLMAITENYPELKANENFLALQAQIEGTENRISVERRRYNEAVQDYNTYIRKFPNFLFKGDAKPKQMFKAQSGAEKAPDIKF